MKLSSLSIFFPVYNDAHTISELVKKAYSVGAECAHNVEVILVNDGSTDETEEKITKLQKDFPTLRVITHETNRGYGAALQSGFSAAKKTWVFYTDADGQYDVGELKLLVKEVKEGVDVVNGFKLTRSDNAIRVLGGNVYNFMLHKLYTLPIKDVDCDFRLIKRNKLKRRYTSTSGAICAELISSLARSKATFAEVGVHHYPRKHGRSQFFSPKPLLQTLIDHVILLMYAPS